MKAYRAQLEIHQDWVFYRSETDDLLTPVGDSQKPQPRCSQSWDKTTKTFQTAKPPYYDRVIFPRYQMPAGEVQDFVDCYLLDVIKYTSKKKNYNILLVTKPWADGIVELALAGSRGRFQQEDVELSRKIEQLMKMKAFW